MTKDGMLLAWLDQTTWFGVSLTSGALAVAAALTAYLAMTVGLRIALGRLSLISAHTKTRLDDAFVEVLSSTNRGLLALAALLIGVGMLDLSARWEARLSQLWFVAVAIQVALWVNRLIGVLLRRHLERHASTGAAQMSAAATLMAWGLHVAVWTVVLLGILSNLGINVTTFVASLGVGGIAIALAVQNILGDLFASLSIAIDKPFEVGDLIALGSITGTVEHVGLKTTRIRSLSGEQVVMSNTELLKQTIRNYKRLAERRIVFSVGVTYGATPEQLAQVPEVVQKVVQASEHVRFDRAHFKSFGESSLDFEVVYMVLDTAYRTYMDEQHRINLGLVREFAAIGVEFAFPTRTIYMNSTVPAVQASR